MGLRCKPVRSGASPRHPKTALALLPGHGGFALPDALRPAGFFPCAVLIASG